MLAYCFVLVAYVWLAYVSSRNKPNMYKVSFVVHNLTFVLLVILFLVNELFVKMNVELVLLIILLFSVFLDGCFTIFHQRKQKIITN